MNNLVYDDIEGILDVVDNPKVRLFIVLLLKGIDADKITPRAWSMLYLSDDLFSLLYELGLSWDLDTEVNQHVNTELESRWQPSSSM